MVVDIGYLLRAFCNDGEIVSYTSSSRAWGTEVDTKSQFLFILIFNPLQRTGIVLVDIDRYRY
jgi:hypothetical protein